MIETANQIAALAKRGVFLSVQDGDLVVTAEKTVPLAVALTLETAKPRLVRYLSANHPTPRSTAPTSQPEPLMPPVDPADAGTYLRHLQRGGKLDAFGSQKLDVIRAKLEQNDETWLFRLARSRELYRLLGFLPIEKAA